MSAARSALPIGEIQLTASRFEIEFVDADDGKRFGRAFFILYRHRCAEGDAVRCRVRRIDNMDRRQNLFEFDDALAVRVFRAKLLAARRANVSRRAR